MESLLSKGWMGTQTNQYYLRKIIVKGDLESRVISWEDLQKNLNFKTSIWMNERL